VTIGNQTRD